MLLTLEAHRRLARAGLFTRVLLDGRDVTNECQCADNRQGYALVLVCEGGRPCTDPATGTVRRRLALGQVRFATPYGDLPARWQPGLLFTFLRTSRS